jgi:hypothetical protein
VVSDEELIVRALVVWFVVNYYFECGENMWCALRDVLSSTLNETVKKKYRWLLIWEYLFC